MGAGAGSADPTLASSVCAGAGQAPVRLPPAPMPKGISGRGENRVLLSEACRQLALRPRGHLPPHGEGWL